MEIKELQIVVDKALVDNPILRDILRQIQSQKDFMFGRSKGHSDYTDHVDRNVYNEQGYNDHSDYEAHSDHTDYSDYHDTHEEYRESYSDKHKDSWK